MKIEVSCLIAAELLTYKQETILQHWLQPFIEMENKMFQQKIFTYGPAIFSLDIRKFGAPDMAITYYLPISDVPDFNQLSTYNYTEKLAFPNTLVVRQGQDFENFFAAFKEVKVYCQTHRLQISTQAYFVLTPVYDQYFIDIHFVLPALKGEVQ